MMKILFVLLTLATTGLAQDFSTLRTPIGKPRPAPERIVFHTIAGPIVMGLFPDVAPEHVKQIKKLVQIGAYDGTHFSRVEPNFVLQLSAVHDRRPPLSGDQLAAVHPIPGEFSAIRHHFGTLSMARFPDNPNSAESSFSILLGAAPHLDGQYTIFGEVESGFDVIQELASVPRAAKNVPAVRLEVFSAEIMSDQGRLNELRATRANPVAVPKQSLTEINAGEKIGTLIGTLLVVLLIFLCQFLLDRKLSPRLRASFSLLGVFVAYFGLVASLIRDGQRNTWVAVALFLGVLSVIRLMGRFDAPQ
jgi:cyclophilin family peptidyl-prolyl cis-trans isomerase